jgi:hypothetical protein
MSKFKFDHLILSKTSKFNLKPLTSSENKCRINWLFPLLTCPLVHNNIVIIITGAHVLLTIQLPPPPELEQLRVQMLPGKVWAAEVAARERGSKKEMQVLVGGEGGRREGGGGSLAPRGRHHPTRTCFWISHPPAAAAPAGVGATSGSNAAWPSVCCCGCGYGAAAAAPACMCAHDGSWKLEGGMGRGPGWRTKVKTCKSSRPSQCSHPFLLLVFRESGDSSQKMILGPQENKI